MRHYFHFAVDGCVAEPVLLLPLFKNMSMILSSTRYGIAGSREHHFREFGALQTDEDRSPCSSVATALNPNRTKQAQTFPLRLSQMVTKQCTEVRIGYKVLL